MQKYMEEKYMDKNSKELFDSFEKKYDSKILQKIKSFSRENLKSNSIFNSIFKNISNTTMLNSKIYSKLKHE
jgi:hypothetical protein